jgi:FMN phosphatase YigB (HAD superfamily)
MKQVEAVIFDLDGTLYPFPDGGTFTQIPFGQTISRNVTDFIQREFDLTREQAERRREELHEQFNGEMSLGLESAFGIDRMRFFAETWDLQPEEFVLVPDGIRRKLGELSVPLVLLSAAPRVWVDRVLAHMQIAEVFEGRVITGEPDIRKPSEKVFRLAAEMANVPVETIVSIGDQEYTDIIPAKSIGMMALRIGSNETSADAWAPDICTAIDIAKERIKQ